MLRPLELKGDMLIGLRKITVFANEDGKVVLGLMGVHGTLSLPLTRRAAADLASLLTRSLVEHGSRRGSGITFLRPRSGEAPASPPPALKKLSAVALTKRAGKRRKCFDQSMNYMPAWNSV
jgi:hypothetical protein